MTERAVHISANNDSVSLAPSPSFHSINGCHGKTHDGVWCFHFLGKYRRIYRRRRIVAQKVFACHSHASSLSYNDGKLCFESLLFVGFVCAADLTADKSGKKNVTFNGVLSKRCRERDNLKIIQGSICTTFCYSEDQNSFGVSLWLRSFQAICDRCFIGRSTVVVDVLSMIQCRTSHGRERQRERCLCLDVQRRTFNI